MVKKVKRFIPFLPPLIWMGLIFFASSRHRIGAGGNYWVSFAFFKTLHVLIYGMLYTLWRLAFHYIDYADILAVTISFIYGITDEIHQSFVSTREGTARDVFINLIGILLFSFLFDKYLLPRIKKIDLAVEIFNLGKK